MNGYPRILAKTTGIYARIGTIESSIERGQSGSMGNMGRYAVLWRIQTARNTQARAKRISDLVAMLKKKETFHPWTFK